MTFSTLYEASGLRKITGATRFGLLALTMGLSAFAQTSDGQFVLSPVTAPAGIVRISTATTNDYWVADHLIEGKAFEFPETKGRPHRPPDLIDYLFIAFNTNATFGPTTEAVISRRVKALMMLQTVCSLLVLMVLVARVVGLRN